MHIRTQSLFALALLTCCSIVGTNFAQDRAGQEKSTPAAKKTKSADDKKAADAKKEAEEKAKKEETERLQKIGQLKLDRRKSTILKAWAGIKEGPEKKDPDDEKEPDPFEIQLQEFQKNVTLGNWPAVKTFLAKLPKKEAKAAYKHLLTALQRSPGPAQPSPGGQRGRIPEKNFFTLDDVLWLARVAPHDLDRDVLKNLAGILRLALQQGNVIETFTDRLQGEVKMPKAKGTFSRRQAAVLLCEAGQAIEAGAFLPSLKQATADRDYEALNLLSRHYLALHAREKKTELLEQAWRVTQAILSSAKVAKEEKEEAIKRAVELAPRIREELGEKWLAESFTHEAKRGMEIIAVIGADVSLGLEQQALNPTLRLKGLQLQTTAVQALLKASPKRAKEWRETLTFLASNWLKEAEFSYQRDTSTQLGPILQRDIYGNYYYMRFGMPAGRPTPPNQPRPIKTADLLEIKPKEDWLALVTEGLRPRFDRIFAQLYLKVREEKLAFPYIERVAKAHPEKGKELVEEFLRVWTNNHDPNANRNRTNPYMFMYGFEQRAESIPLTRSKQERNLEELSRLVPRLKSLPIGELNEELLAKAFTTCHSSAEVYRLESIEKVFGSLDKLKPKTLAAMVHQMRKNLSGLWRDPSVQKKKKTRRKQKDIRAEVLRGYQVARGVVAKGLERYPDHWALHLAEAALQHDENNYRKEIAPSSKFSKKLQQSFAGFQKAAQLYAAQVKDLTEDDETTQVYELWLYASLGACDLRQINEETVPDPKQPPLIRKAILALPGEAAKRHMDKFANTLFTRLSSVKPEVKFRYLKSGFAIVGDHKLAHEARKVFDYYKDLVTEIKLETKIDGSDVVGHTEPFGVFVNLVHTREIERESGGFGRYLQNQNSMFYAYNYGRPLANYRDRFEEIVRKALSEHFEVLSVTFQKENVNSRAIEGKYGWRVTPYGYVLLKAKGPEVDKLPSVHIDLDFLDTSGYVILPIESPVIPLDASPKKGEQRPLSKLEVTQILDERQANKGKLILEVKAKAQGLLPAWQKLIDLPLDEFEIAKVDDQGLAVSRFDPDSEKNVIISERTWLINLKAKEGLAARPSEFHFGSARLDGAKVLHYRYNDADLVEVPKDVSLLEEYGSPSLLHYWIVGGGLLLLVLAVPITLFLIFRKKPEQKTSRFQLPEKITPFTVLGLLQQIERHNGLDETGQHELRRSITRLEEFYFSRVTSEQPNLHEIADFWIKKTS